jgi:hypothetical protein
VSKLSRIVQVYVACERGDVERAEALCNEMRGIYPQFEEGVGDSNPNPNDTEHWVGGRGHAALARLALCRGDTATAVNQLRQALHHERLRNGVFDVFHALEHLGWALAADGQAAEAARAMAVAARAHDEIGIALLPVDRPHHGRALEVLHQALDEEAFAAAWAAGEAMSVDEAAAWALEPL